MAPNAVTPTLVEVPKLLDLDYAPAVPADVLAQVESIAKGAGLSLEEIELIGQDLQSCRDFVQISNVVGVQAAVETMDWLMLESLWLERRN